MKKRYVISGMMEWHPVFRTGRSRLQISFTGGNLCGGAATAASYETSDPVVQRVIEDSVYFKSNRIRLAGSWDETPPPAKEPQKKIAQLEYTDVGNLRDSLHFNYKIPLLDLKDEETCRKEAEKLGIQLIKTPTLPL